MKMERALDMCEEVQNATERLPSNNSSPYTDETLGANAFRLTMRSWLFVLLIGTLFCLGITPLWQSIETVESDSDYRIPYALSRDYWLYSRHVERQAEDTNAYYVIGDSVVWGEYVCANGTLSHFLNERKDSRRHFVNAGINGLFPLALEGLIRYHASAIRDRDILLHCNLLWMSNSDADMSRSKEQTFNHVDLVPQFRPQIPCYRASLNERLGISIRRRLDVFGWVGHLQQCYFEQRDIPNWTLKDNGTPPARYPNANRLPLGQITLKVPNEPAIDSLRGPNSSRHRPWFERGLKPQAFEWVNPSTSLQWGAFRRLALLLKSRGNRVRVMVGPFNEHMVAATAVRSLETWKDTVSDWCSGQGIKCQTLAPLESQLYGDASHPLTEGYRTMARMINF